MRGLAVRNPAEKRNTICAQAPGGDVKINASSSPVTHFLPQVSLQQRLTKSAIILMLFLHEIQNASQRARLWFWQVIFTQTGQSFIIWVQDLHHSVSVDTKWAFFIFYFLTLKTNDPALSLTCYSIPHTWPCLFCLFGSAELSL